MMKLGYKYICWTVIFVLSAPTKHKFRHKIQTLFYLQPSKKEFDFWRQIRWRKSKSYQVLCQIIVTQETPKWRLHFFTREKKIEFLTREKIKENSRIFFHTWKKNRFFNIWKTEKLCDLMTMQKCHVFLTLVENSYFYIKCAKRVFFCAWKGLLRRDESRGSISLWMHKNIFAHEI
jgi:hypothetical protein